MTTPRKKKPTFEKAIERLEAIVEKLEEGETSLDESIKLFQEGRELGRQCAARLADVEKKARLLLEEEDGAVVSRPLDAETDDDEPEDEPADTEYEEEE